MLYQVTRHDEPIGIPFHNCEDAWEFINDRVAYDKTANPGKRVDWESDWWDPYDIDEITEPIDILTGYGIPEDAAQFFIDWVAPSEFDYTVFDPHVIFGDRLCVLTEQDLADELKYAHCDGEDEFIDKGYAGGIWRDASFDGILVWFEG